MKLTPAIPYLAEGHITEFSKVREYSLSWIT